MTKTHNATALYAELRMITREWTEFRSRRDATPIDQLFALRHYSQQMANARAEADAKLAEIRALPHH